MDYSITVDLQFEKGNINLEVDTGLLRSDPILYRIFFKPHMLCMLNCLMCSEIIIIKNLLYLYKKRASLNGFFLSRYL